MADEVRNLALRAAEAAKNTSNLIEGTVKRVQAFVNDLVALVGGGSTPGKATAHESSPEAPEVEPATASRATRPAELDPEQILPLEGKND